MTTLARCTVPYHVSPSVRHALGELATLLADYHYSQHAREAICAYVAREGTVTGAPGLDPDDEADASMVFEAELAPVPFDSPAWDRDAGAVYLDVALLASGTHPMPFGGEPDDFDAAMEADDTSMPLPTPTDLRAPEEWPIDTPDVGYGAAPDQGWYHPFSPNHPANLVPAIPPVCGGAPEPEFTPSPEDLADYSAWSEDLDRRREMGEWYSDHPLAEFNALRTD